MPQDPKAERRLTLVTGPSGAGRSTALNVLEDLGFETIDNLPLSLVPRLFESGETGRDMALGIDVRTRDFSPAALVGLLAELANRLGAAADLVFLDAAPDVLQARYSETRRRHPLAPDGTPETGIARELELLAPVRDHATILLDTSELSPHELRIELQRFFATNAAHGMAVSVQSFSYKRGLPRGADVVFDCRFLDNPHWVPDLRELTGLDARVARHIEQDDCFAPFRAKVLDLLLFQLPAARGEGKAHFAVGFGCTGGKHRSVAMAETVADGLAHEGWQVSIRHRELERRALDPSGDGLIAPDNNNARNG
ncbi:RNase adapter RapZ [Primorskyibacter aestuariivivens]|uniref:RNase adapter RapZ n=1 Tax=Primorskyibacter aestuariivivens TaxID=1888912 RepID=UPI00230057B0|nr:RNase adapter RapZ [Primorskyibacter aestuariivivens]MDA7429252.1 RNase adapter RapZ [Primorskyibacter aestuariivivens]